MKIITKKDILKKGLDIVERITGQNFSLPILNNILLETHKNHLTLSGTDLEIGINYSLLGKIEKEGKITIPSKILSNLINFLPDEEIKLETKENTLFVSCKDFTSQVKGLPAEDFPIIPQVKNKENFIEVDNIPFLNGLLKVYNFCSLGRIHPELSGVYFNFQKDKLELVSTDSFRLAKVDIYHQTKLEKTYSFILPQKSVKEIVNILSENENLKSKIYLDVNQIFIEFSSKEVSSPVIYLTSRLIEGEYPNYQEIFPEEYKTSITLNKNEFLNQIKANALFSGRVNKIKIKTDIKKSILLISSQDSETGEIKSSLHCEINGEEIETFFNFKFLIDGLSNIKEENVIFKLNGVESDGREGPSLLKALQDQSYSYILMPLKD